MSLRAGTQMGSLEIGELLGVGGMGEVYRARDTKLKRDVAIKILPDELSRDPHRISRFQREAQFLASLNHPNIAAIYDLQEAEDRRFLVLELVEGPTLADRLERGPIPIAEALAIAQQIANALEAAHERGVIHRDLKPANIKVTADGRVKVLDFGLAKGVRGENTGLDLSQLRTTLGSEAGIILGTPAYMSPEQARGLAVDKRTDIWAFGCVLYEMLTGRALFRGATVTDTLAAVLEREPDWAALPATTPAGVRRLLERCLAKDPKRRLRDIGDAMADLDDKNPLESPTPPGYSFRAKVGLSLATILIATLSIALWSLWSSREQPLARQGIVQTTIELPENQSLATGFGVTPLAISPDGARIAYVVQQEEETRLYVRELASLESKPIPGTAGARHPFFSPNGQSIGFFASGALQIVSVAGGAPRRLCMVTGESKGGSWGPDDTIVWASSGSDLMKISLAGGVPQALAGSKPADWPEILPDGKNVLFTTGGAIAAMSLNGGTRQIVARTANPQSDKPAMLGSAGGISQVRFVADGSYLVYGQNQNPGGVRVLQFDPVTLTSRGSVIPLVDSVERAPAGGGVYFAVSRTGLLVYSSTGDLHQLVWVDRNGSVTPISADRAAFRLPALSRDDRIAVAVNDETRRSNIYIYDAESGKGRRLTSKSHDLDPVWGSDGRLTFHGAGLLSVSTHAGGTVSPEILLSEREARSKLPAANSYSPTSWLNNGRTLLIYAANGLWLLSQDGNSGPRAFVQTPVRGRDGQFSPDGQWVVYSSDETGRSEIYVRRYPDFGNPSVISRDGGTKPRWSRNGSEIFYRQDDAMMAVSIQTKPVFHADNPQHLFTGRFTGAGQDRSFDVTADGKKFLMVQSDPAANLQQLTVVQNWFAELKRQASARK